MAVELKVPSFGESITEALVARWLKQPGEPFAQDELLVVLETDKVTQELPAPVAGTLAELQKKEGEYAKIGDVLALIAEGAAPAAPPAPAPAAAPPVPPVVAPAAPAPSATPGAAPFVMPAAARALHDAGLAPAQVAPTGPGGRLLKEDVQRAAAAGSVAAPGAVAVPGAPPAAAPPPPPAPGAGMAALPSAPARNLPTHPRLEEAVPMTPLRKRAAERLVQAKQVTASLTTFNEIDMSNVIALRAEFKEAFEKKYGVRLGFMSFFVKAAIEALKEVPQVNAEIRGETIVYRNYYDVGIAVGGGRGLVVPIIRNAEKLSFAEIELKIAEYAGRAKDNKLTLDELTGGTFTISNGGIYGSMLSTPILNHPQSGILGLHAIQDRPVAMGGQVVIRPMMFVALTYDHRVIDGRESVTFLKRIKECVENPQRILLEV
ncbi:MAG: 2-oxoglutarate dehydrogenase complex dihydrolipoyllysine-residue succinyltransferase [Acidobacteria bacterium]|jgi:2-oxoglutarate dehydrogenase E2 component (dihydrolipoamide succinyltransferase)|nr:2-oxoglutarate dehydrogenase complex dihydrolipoyllysine-residue succinyltransferase [Acidobacteriota bacterium]